MECHIDPRFLVLEELPIEEIKIPDIKDTGYTPNRRSYPVTLVGTRDVSVHLSLKASPLVGLMQALVSPQALRVLRIT